MAETTLDPAARRAKDDAAMERLDEIMPAINEGLARIRREEAWSDAERKYRMLCEATKQADAEWGTMEKGTDAYDVQGAIWSAVVDAGAEALKALMQTPAPNGAAIIRKLELCAAGDFDISPEWLEWLLDDARRVMA